MNLPYRESFLNSLAGMVVFSSALVTLDAAVPVITGFEPKLAAPGSTITLRGDSFGAAAGENIVYFGGVRAMVTAASSTNLQVAVPLGAMFSPITVTVNGLTAASGQPFLPTFPGAASPIGPGTLEPAFTMAAPLGPGGVVFADLDNDGRLDMVVGNGRAYSIWILRNTGTNSPLSAASFDAPIEVAVPASSPYKMRTADIDGDGRLDLIIAGVSLSQIFIFRNITEPGGKIALAPRVDLQTGADCRFARAADMDGDGRLDIVTANYGANSVSIQRNIGAPGGITADSFAPRVDLSAPTGPYELAIGDLDGDSRPDIALATYGRLISVYRNGSTPGVLDTNSFARMDFEAPAEADTVELGDLDGDGLLDVVIGSVAPNLVSVYRNLGVAPFSTNSLAARVDFFNGNWVHDVRLADFDGDGKADVAVDGELPSYLSIYQNLAAPGSFTTESLGTRVDFGTGWNAWGLAVGDLDGDGRPDAALANHWDNTLTVYRNTSAYAGPPVITLQPVDQVVVLGEPATFTVQAQGSASLAYQWWSVPGVVVPGATNATLEFAEVTDAMAGTYWVVVTNVYGAVTSAPAMLLLTNMAPYITAQPLDALVMRDGTATFTVNARGSRPLYYQWRWNGTNLAGATDSALSLAGVQRHQAGLYSVEVTNSFGSATSRDAHLTVQVPPSGVAVVATTNVSGWPVTVAIGMNASGEENAVSFSIVFGGPQRGSPFRFESASLGAGAGGAWVIVNTNDLAYGQVGIALALPAGATFARGWQEIVLLEFESAVTTTKPIVFTLRFADQPVPRQVADPLAVSLPAYFTNGPVTLLPTDIEGDSSPRPDGNRAVTINDWVQAGRFVAGLDTPAPGGEFQRADCAPRETRGDGRLKVTDWVQAGRYFAKLDPLTAMGGASSPVPGAPVPGPMAKDLGREIRVVSAEGFPGVELEVPVELQSQGDENGLGFTLRFDPGRLQFASASLGTDAAAAGASLNVNPQEAGSGSVGLVLALPTGTVFNPGARKVVNARFVPQTGATGSEVLTFGDGPVLRAVSDAAANELPAAYVSGAVSLNPLPTLAIMLSGTNLVLAWPSAAVGFELQTAFAATNGGPGWSTVTAVRQTNGSTLTVTLPVAETQRFFRLRHP